MAQRLCLAVCRRGQCRSHQSSFHICVYVSVGEDSDRKMGHQTPVSLRASDAVSQSVGKLRTHDVYTVKPVFKTTWETGTTWKLRTATSFSKSIHYIEMALRNKTTSEFRTVFDSPLGVPNSKVPLYIQRENARGKQPWRSKCRW